VIPLIIDFILPYWRFSHLSPSPHFPVGCDLGVHHERLSQFMTETFSRVSGKRRSGSAGTGDGQPGCCRVGFIREEL
jgi:hypothetical protein